jgi:hypothetical protein
MKLCFQYEFYRVEDLKWYKKSTTYNFENQLFCQRFSVGYFFNVVKGENEIATCFIFRATIACFPF